MSDDYLSVAVTFYVTEGALLATLLPDSDRAKLLADKINGRVFQCEQQISPSFQLTLSAREQGIALAALANVTCPLCRELRDKILIKARIALQQAGALI